MKPGYTAPRSRDGWLGARRGETESALGLEILLPFSELGAEGWAAQEGGFALEGDLHRMVLMIRITLEGFFVSLI